jgi:hypothetical protein
VRQSSAGAPAFFGQPELRCFLPAPAGKLEWQEMWQFQRISVGYNQWQHWICWKYIIYNLKSYLLCQA